MSIEDQLLARIESLPHDRQHTLVYADWLAERDAPRSEALRILWTLGQLDPDHIIWSRGELRLGELRGQLDDDWLRHVSAWFVDVERGGCGCEPPPYWDDDEEDEEGDSEEDGESHRPDNGIRPFHRRLQDTTAPAWVAVCEQIEAARAAGARELAPLKSLSREARAELITLPPSLGELPLRSLYLYGHSFCRLPPEIGQLRELKSFNTYVGYELHWYPGEMLQCRLRGSQVSTRTLYGNYKNRMPFPKLEPPTLEPLWGIGLERKCAVCEASYQDLAKHRAWLSIGLGGDVWPLLVNACSEGCLQQLPAPAPDYVDHPHRGGPEVRQPPRDW